MKVVVDMPACDGHAKCVEACPDVFSIGDDDEQVTLLDEHPGERHREAVLSAARLCPKAAIRVLDGEGGEEIA